MAAPTLVIGVGGTGIRVLLRVKERFLEAYDEVPREVILYELDTDDYKESRDDFNGVRLSVEGERIGDIIAGPQEAEFYHVATKNINQTLDAVFKYKEQGDPAWQWINVDRLRRTLTKAEDRVIKVGARTVRPVGRSALFLDYSVVYGQLLWRLERIAGLHDKLLTVTEGGETAGALDIADDRKATVFVVASVAGGSGAGMVIDLLRMIEHMRTQGALQDRMISVMTLLVGGSCFTDQRGERTDSNSFATLRELDRLGAVAGHALNGAVPPVIWAPDPVGRFTSQLGPADMILLFDKPDRLGRDRNVPRNVPNAYLDWVIAPTLADLIMSFADERIVPAMRTVRADMGDKWQRKDPHTDSPGHFPYASAGIHTLIFPERDVRKSAGLRLLLELWDDYLVPDESAQSATGDDLPPATRELWGEERSEDRPLTPRAFTAEGFLRDPVCKGAANNQFLWMVVFSAMSERLQLPPASRLFGLFGGRSMIKRVLVLIGLPNIGANRVDVERVADRLERDIDRSIELLDRCRDIREIKEWRNEYLGEGMLGNETGGLWVKWLENAESVRGHQADFRDVLQKTVRAILNDADPLERKLPYRLEYARKVLHFLEQHVLRLTQGDPQDPAQGSLLSEYFRKQIKDEAKARQRVGRVEPEASRGEQSAAYLRVNKDYARKKKELVGMYLLEVLCNDLLNEIRKLQAKLDGWQRFLWNTRRMIGEAQTQHEQNRIQKARIPVRTYVVERPKKGYFKDSQFEQKLYDKHRLQALDGFRKANDWVWDEEGELQLKAPFAKSPSPSLTAAELAERAIAWACTQKGNFDRPDMVSPLRDLGGPAEVNMAVRIRDFFGASGVASLSNRMTSDPYLASLCPLDNWPRTRLMFALGLPRTATPEDNVNQFYDQAIQEIQVATASPQFDQRRPMIFDPENPRHAVAAEFAVGFKLHHRTDQKSYANAYVTDSNNYFALHCMPEEDRASTYYELEFKPDSELYKDVGLDPMQLVPAVVDVLGNKERVELFVRLLAVRAIDLLPREQRLTDGKDFYLWPTVRANRIRLSKMNTPEEINTIAQDLAPTADGLLAITKDDKVLNRLRLMYALRTFVLLEHDVDSDKRIISYETIDRRATQLTNSFSLDERVSHYSGWIGRFLEYYTDYRDRYPTLAHLGLVLARVAHDLRYIEEHKGE